MSGNKPSSTKDDDDAGINISTVTTDNGDDTNKRDVVKRIHSPRQNSKEMKILREGDILAKLL